jgi:nucleotide-binding universal stress UspA family protein
MEGTDDPIFRTIEDQAQRVIHDAQDILGASGLEAAGHVVDGSPAQIIASTAKEFSCGLIVIGHRYLSFWAHLLDPSVCVELLDVTTCPVLTVPDGH